MASDDRDIHPHLDAETGTRPSAAEGRELGSDAIFVLGMHRSGTSALARVLNLMGAYVGAEQDLMPAHAQDNPTGYWERRELVIAHDDFLRVNGYAWDRIAGFDPQQLDADASRRLTTGLRDVVARMAQAGKPWLIKDPRLCLLLPQWLALCSEAACVVVVRDPREIAASMQTSHRGVYTSHFLLALWEKYLRCALAALAGRRVLFVSYAQLLADPLAEASRLREGLHALGVHGLTAPTAAQLQGFLDKQLRRSAVKPHVELSPRQQELMAWLEAQCRIERPVAVGGFPQAASPDAVLREFERTLDDNAARSRAAALGESAQRLADLEATFANVHARLIAELGAQREVLQSAHAENAVLRSQLGEVALHVQALEAAHAQLEQQRTELTQQSAHRQERIDHLDGEYAHLLDHARALEQRVQAMRNSLSWKVSAPLRGIASLFTLRFSWSFERSLYRAYYALPGISDARKRAFIEWLHRRAGWLTRNTLSYKVHAQVQELKEQRANDPAAQQSRMDQGRADALLATLQDPPLISIVMPIYNVERRWLLAAVDSVRHQFYPHWELCLADDASTRAETRQALVEIEALGERRIRVQRSSHNAGIAGASNVALEMASGDYVGLLDHDDALTRDALIEVAQAICSDGSDLVYSDEDKLDSAGRHVEPHFKPDFSADLLFSINYLCHFSVIRRRLLSEIGGFRAGFDGAQDYDLMLRITERSERITHIPKVLYHWRKVEGSTAASTAAKPAASDAGRRALAESLQRRGIEARVVAGPFPTTFHVRRAIQGSPLISIIVPFRDKPELLEGCVTSVLEKTSYANFELIGVDNYSVEAATHELMRTLQQRDARVRFIRYAAPFNYSAVNNFAVREARGEHLLFLNNDTQVIAPDWLEALLEHSQRPEVGVVGAKLLYADDTLQHTGVIVGIGGVAGHPHLFLPAQHPGYFARAQLTQNVSAVTFACAMTRRDVFEKLGGLNERDLCVAFNDVDYCLRAREAGYLLVYTPNALLYHYESKSRGYEDNPEKQRRFAGETAYIQQRHAAALQRGDPYYNPNLSLLHAYQPAVDYVATLPA